MSLLNKIRAMQILGVANPDLTPQIGRPSLSRLVRDLAIVGVVSSTPSFADGSLVMNGVTYSSARALPATFTDWECKIRTAKANEARFNGLRRVANIVTYSQQITNAGGQGWALGGGTGSPATSVPVCTLNAGVAPDGTNTATRIQFALNGNVSGGTSYVRKNGSAGRYVCSWYLKTNDGSTKQIALYDADNVSTVVSVTPTWQRFARPVSSANGFIFNAVGLIGGSTSDSADILAWGFQTEEVTGQSNQNPGEYVSTNVLSSPFQGAGVDGVKYFSTQNANTVSGSVVTSASGRALVAGNALALATDGGSTSFVKTPHNANQYPANGLTLVACFSTASLATNQAIVSANNNTGSGFSWGLIQNSSGKLYFQVSQTGGTTVGYNCPTFLPAVNVDLWVRVDHVLATSSATFYYSTDYGATWVQQGATQTGAALTSYFTTNGGVVVAQTYSNGTGPGLNGTVKVVRMYGGTGGPTGTPVFNYDATRFVSGSSSAVMSTGETWTLQGAASILFEPLTGLLIEGNPCTNSLLYSQDFSNAAWTATNVTQSIAGNLAPDGSNTMQLLTTTGTSASIEQTITIASGQTRVVSFYFRKAATTDFYFALQVSDGAGNGVNFWWTTNGGVVGGTSIGTGWSQSIAPVTENLGGGFYRMSFSVSTTGTNFVTKLFPAVSSAIALTGTSGQANQFWGMQNEAANTTQQNGPSSYLPTTSAAVTRPADQISYSTSGVTAAASGSILLDLTPTMSGGAGSRIWYGNLNAEWYWPNVAAVSATDGTNSASGPGGIATPYTRYKWAWAWASSQQAVARNGTAGSAGTFNNNLSIGATAYLLYRSGQPGWNAIVHNIKHNSTNVANLATATA